MHRWSRWLWMGNLLMATGSAVAADAGTGFSPNTDPGWARWQGRVSVSTSTPSWRAELTPRDLGGLKVQGLGVMGDYYLTRSPLWHRGAGGFRATSGVLLGNTAPVWNISAPGSTAFSIARRTATNLTAGAAGSEPSADAGAVPYLGVGYTGVSVKGGWGFAADVGVMALGPASSVRLGRTVNASQNLDEQVRELRLRPVLQLGVSYSF